MYAIFLGGIPPILDINYLVQENAEILYIPVHIQ